MKLKKWDDSLIVQCKGNGNINCNGPTCFYFNTCWKGIFEIKED